MFQRIHLISLTQELFAWFCSILAEQGTQPQQQVCAEAGREAAFKHSRDQPVHFYCPPSSKTTAKLITPSKLAFLWNDARSSRTNSERWLLLWSPGPSAAHGGNTQPHTASCKIQQGFIGSPALQFLPCQPPLLLKESRSKDKGRSWEMGLISEKGGRRKAQGQLQQAGFTALCHSRSHPYCASTQSNLIELIFFKRAAA